MNPSLQPLLESPWGGIIGIYLILVGLATGVTLLSFWVHPHHDRQRTAYEWRTTWVAFLALAAACVLLIIDLGRPARFYLMITSFANLSSPMSIGAKLIAVKLFLLVIYLWLLARRRQAQAAGDTGLNGRGTHAIYVAVPFVLAILSLVLAVYPAVLLAKTWSSPLVRASGGGVLFLSTALLMGTAATLLVVSIGRAVADSTVYLRLRQTLLFLVLAQGPLLGLWYLSVDTSQPLMAAALSRLFQDTAAVLFWCVVIGLGLVLPTVALLALCRRQLVAMCAAVAVLAGASTMRYLFFALP
jgi:formate-dependent nitrite reductase membrane component NrfD